MAAFLVVVLPFAIANIALGSESERGILWKNLHAMACSDDIKSQLNCELVPIEKDLSTICGILEYANSYIAVLNHHQIPNAQGHFIVFLMCLFRENKIVICEDELVDEGVKHFITTNRRAMLNAICELLCELYANDDLPDNRIINEIADQVYEAHSGDNWQDRDCDARFAHAQAIVGTIIRILGEYNNLTITGVRVHANSQCTIPDVFGLLVRVIAMFYGVEAQLTAIRRNQYTYEHGAQGVFPVANEISPFFIGNTPP